ncbi:MAG: bifunctional 3-demethylubiquinol 3-O-methyltransferase/2-polyprenyl-6-hydroxyphenol methylase [Rhodospirillaceae bacterium]|nr:bifunctional 3-demethylubiquinol 3-O-methyltransferase/2-polyprenyl-6-hydroxyphenol methylase [Rhodospirillaceae bacterium]|tara:strand:+ start:4028 stop:4789 length:762 start_codon:yes stop_codon:yes gene_type:complete
MTTQADHNAGKGTIDADEVRSFSAVADQWWDQNGPFKPLHRLNPVRVGYLRDRMAAHFDHHAASERPLEGLRVADVGCGGGLVTEPLARLGASMTGLDASSQAIDVARRHAENSGLTISYQNRPVEDLAHEQPQFDALVAMEIIEHVADREGFVAACCRCVRPGGLLLFSTLNRTPKSFALAIVGAEYLLQWVPRGTHTWSKFVRPSELARDLRRNNVVVNDVSGLVLDISTNHWSLGRDVDVNYILSAPKSA